MVACLSLFTVLGIIVSGQSLFASSKRIFQQLRMSIIMRRNVGVEFCRSSAGRSPVFVFVDM